MSKPRNQHGHVFERHGAFHIRYYVHENGVRKQRSQKLCVKDTDHPMKDAELNSMLLHEVIASRAAVMAAKVTVNCRHS